jgi:cold shock CspA family protein
MNLAFGVVEKFISDRGFGFVTNELPGGKRESYFFHIKSVKKARPELIAGLESGNGTWFWYSLEESPKGKQAVPLDQHQWNVRKQEAECMVEQIEQIWVQAGALPPWLEQVTSELLGTDRTMHATQERALREAARKRIADEQRQLQEAEILARKVKLEAERARQLAEEDAERAQKAAKEAEEEAEFTALVAETAALGFTQSSQLSTYIRKKQLGYKYKTISGFLTMESDGQQWKFEGGFPPKIYARLCGELGFEKNPDRKSRPVAFVSFEDHKNRTGSYYEIAPVPIVFDD